MGSNREGRKRKQLESGARSGLEWFFLILGLFVGLGVIGGCGAVVVLDPDSVSLLPTLAVLASAAALIGVVYLSTSMSRDVRVLREALLDQKTREPESRPEVDSGP